MNWLSEILTSPNAAIVIIGLIAIIIVLAILAKLGIISFNRAGVKLGVADEERAVLRNQIDYIDVACNGMVSKLPNKFTEGDSYYHTKYVIQKVISEFIKIVSYNHLTDDEAYLTTKQEVIYFTILKRTNDVYFRSEEFRDLICKFTRDLIKQLIKIRALSK